MRLKKKPEKAQLFQDICDLLRPLTNLCGDCLRLAAQLNRVSSWDALETLCAQYIQQDPRLPQSSPSSTNAPGVPTNQQCPLTQSVSQASRAPAKCSSELAALSTPPV